MSEVLRAVRHPIRVQLVANHCSKRSSVPTNRGHPRIIANSLKLADRGLGDSDPLRKLALREVAALAHGNKVREELAIFAGQVQCKLGGG